MSVFMTDKIHRHECVPSVIAKSEAFPIPERVSVVTSTIMNTCQHSVVFVVDAVTLIGVCIVVPGLHYTEVRVCRRCLPIVRRSVAPGVTWICISEDRTDYLSYIANTSRVISYITLLSLIEEVCCPAAALKNGLIICIRIRGSVRIRNTTRRIL